MLLSLSPSLLLLVHPQAELGILRYDGDHLELVRRLQQVLGVGGGRITVGAAGDQQPDVGVQRELPGARRLESQVDGISQ